MTHNFYPQHSTESTIDSTLLAGFVVKTLPNITTVSIWAGDVELKAFLSPDQTLKLTKMLISGSGVFVDVERIKRFNLAADAS